MINKLVNNSSNDKNKLDPSNKGLKGTDGSRGNSSFLKWIVWFVILSFLVGIVGFMLSPNTRTTSVGEYSYEKSTGTVSFTHNGKKYNIKNNSEGRFVGLNDLNFVYMVQTDQGTVYLSGLVTSGSKSTSDDSSKKTTTSVSYPVYILTAAQGSNLCYYDDPDGKQLKIGKDSATLGSLKWLNGFNQTLVLANPLKATIGNFFSSFAVLILVWVALYALFTRRMRMDGSGDSVFTIGKSLAKLAKTNVKFSDVAGIEEEKNELVEVVDYLKHPGKYVAMGARIPRGVILYGPPGTGKTLLAKAVAGEAQVPFFQIAGSTFEDMFVGVGAKRVRDLFNRAKKAAPCIIFIDEIDSVGGKRGRSEIIGGNYSTSEQTINQLLGEMDGFETKTGIVIIAATNRIDVLDEALLRPGRFDRHIRISLPDIREREQILLLHAKNKNFSSKINFADIARRTPGFSGAQLESTLNEAVLLAVRANRTVILESDVDEAIDRIVAGPAKVSRMMTERERQQIAYHEAGHALTGLHLNEDEEIQKITIIPRGNAGGYTLSAPKGNETNLKRKSELLNMVAVFMGGRASEEIIYGKDNITSGASDDLFKATNVVRSMVMQLGMSSLGKTQYIPSQGTLNPNSVKLYSDETALAIDREINQILDEAYNKASGIIKNNLDELRLIVDALLTIETIVKKDIEFIHSNKRLPDEIIKLKQERSQKAAQSS